MLENLIQLVKENAVDAIIKNPEVPNEQNDAAIEATAGSIFESLKNQVAGGAGLNALTKMFEGDDDSDDLKGVQNQVSTDAISGLMSKLGISKATATGIAASVIPMVLKSLKSKTNDPNDNSFDLPGIIGALGGGGQTGGLLNKLKGLLGR